MFISKVIYWRAFSGNFVAKWLLLLAFCNLSSTLYAATPSVNPATAQLEKMLAHIGGRTVWAGIRTLTNDSLQFRIEEPIEVRAEIRMDFTQPRWRIDTTAPGLNISRVYTTDQHWRLNRQGVIEPLPAATLEADVQWHRSHVYRTIHRLAANDAALTIQLGADGRLEVLEGKTRIAWFKLDRNGEPYRFGGADDNAGSISGPWRMTDQGIKHPLWVSNADGTWRSQLNNIRVNNAFDRNVFTKPDMKIEN